MEGERNFHIFYQLLEGCDQNTLNSLKLSRDAQSYGYLSNSGVTKVDTIDDGKDWSEVQTALQVMGFSALEKTNMYSMLSVILHLGNVTFEGRENF